MSREHEVSPLPHIAITRHARDRWHQYHGIHRLNPTWVAIMLEVALRHGMHYRDDAVEVRLERDLYGVLVPSPQGGWVLVTVARKRATRRKEMVANG